MTPQEAIVAHVLVNEMLTISSDTLSSRCKIILDESGRVKEPWDLPVGPLVYFWFKDDDCLYVGTTDDLRMRMRCHGTAHGNEIASVSMGWINAPRKRKDRFILEAQVIKKLNPLWNRKHNNIKVALSNPDLSLETADRTTPQFKVGQVVVMKRSKSNTPFRLLSVGWRHDEWYYGRNLDISIPEHMLRKLTAEEIG